MLLIQINRSYNFYQGVHHVFEPRQWRIKQSKIELKEFAAKEKLACPP